MEEKKSKISRFLGVFKEIIFIPLVLIFFRYSILNWYVIPTGSMLPTIKKGDHVLCNNLSYGLMLPFMKTQIFSWDKPKRGDIILFQYPKGTDVYVKRVIGISGDSVRFQNGVLDINGQLVREHSLTDRRILEDMGEGAADRSLYLESGLGENPHFMLKYKSEVAIERIAARMMDSRSGLPHSVMTYSTQGDTTSWHIPQGKLLVMGDNRDSSNDGRFWGFVDEDRVYGKAWVVLYSTLPDSGLPPKFRWDRWFQKLDALPPDLTVPSP